MRRRGALGVLVALLVAGCDSTAPLASGGAPIGSPAPSDVDIAALDPAALATWADFPVDARPRPLLIDELPAVPRGDVKAAAKVDAFGRAEEAIASRYFELAAALPADPPPTVDVTLPDGPARLPTVTARQALDALDIAPSGVRASSTVRITRIAWGTAVFGTDRGGRVLPAWLFAVDGVPGGLAWPAIAPSAYRSTPNVIHGSRVSADGRTLVVTMPAAPGDGCPATPRIRWIPATIETRTAVDIGLRAVADGTVPGAPDPGCGSSCAGCASGFGQQDAVYRIPLAAPLGNRVLLGGDGLKSTAVLSVDPE